MAKFVRGRRFWHSKRLPFVDYGSALCRKPRSPFAPDEAVRDLLLHPRFNGAARQALSGLVAMFSGNRILNLVVSDRGRALGSLGVLYLHAISGGPGEQTGLTVRQFQALCVTCGICSAGRARALLTLMRLTGHVAPVMNMGTRSRKLLIPTERLFEAHRQRWRCFFEALVVIKPEQQLVLALIDQMPFTLAFTRHLGEVGLGGFRLLHHAPALTRVVERNAGLMVVGCLYLAAGESVERQSTSISVSIYDLAKRFGVARAHVRTLLFEAEAAGLVRRDRSTALFVLPSMTQAIDRWVAAMFAVLAYCADAAASDIDWPPEEAVPRSAPDHSLRRRSPDLHRPASQTFPHQ